MSTFFWILGILATAGLTFPIAFAIFKEQFHTQWQIQWKKLEAERKKFNEGYAEAQQWYSRTLQWSQERGRELDSKQQKMQELQASLEEQIRKNNQEKEKFIELYRVQFKNCEVQIKKLKSQLENARQRSKRFAKQSKKTV